MTNLFIVGAMKAGTTSLNELLSQHPSIYFSPIKEPNYFVENLPKSIYEPSRFFNIANYFKNDFPDNLHIANIKDEEQYSKLFSKANKKSIYKAEGSTAYLHAPESAQLIYNFNPKAKIIILLRNPLKRAYSHYKMDLGLGRITDDFNTAMQKNISDFDNNQLSNWSYLGMSIYNENINRYTQLFKENVLLIHFEDLLSDRKNTLGKIFHFLNINKMNLEIPHSNPSRSLRFQKTLYFLKQLGLKDFFSLILPKSLRHFIFKLLSKKNVNPLYLQKETNSKIEAIFKLDMDSLNNSIKD